MLFTACGALAQTWNDFETPPHNYWNVPAKDPATLLHARMAAKEVTLEAGADPRVFLRSYLEALKVPISSQIMVFSKSSLQRTFVSGRNPRVLYFNDDVYVGWMSGGLIEVTGIDPVLGGIFYIFEVPESKATQPVVERRESCLGCHAGGPTSFLPGLMVRSLFTDEDGRSGGEAGPSNGGHHSPFEKRWAGWYVSGELNGMKHLGNSFALAGGSVKPSGKPEEFLPAGLNLRPGSDPVALLLHDHQVIAVNTFMEANYRVRTVLHQAGGSQPVEGRSIPAGDDMEMARQQCDKVVRLLLFSDEVPLPGAVTGNDEFLRDFAVPRRPDKAGRSLRDVDMRTRLLKHRCSYMIYSAAFQGLPTAFQRMVFLKLGSELEKPSADGPAVALPDAERRAILAILDETLPGFVNAKQG